VHGAHENLARGFGALIDLQPIAWCEAGLLCAPWISPDQAAAALARCRFSTSPAPAPAQIPETPARLVAGWYRRSDLHARAPAGVRELVQVAGEGFGPHDHPTTELCLRAIDRLAPGRAVDVGCGSGLLTQAWVASAHGPCHGFDADPGAVAQARGSLQLATGMELARVTIGRIEALDNDDVADATILANLPPVAHRVLVGRVSTAPAAIVVSGTTRADAAPILAHYRALGMRTLACARAGRYLCTTLVRG
jgi:ribosomal protein L11 methylase PrmA